MGHRIAETMVELFADLPPDHPFFEQFSFINQEDIAAYEQLLARIGKMTDLKRLRPGDIEKLIELSFPYNEPRHRLELLDEKLENKIVAARRLFAKNITPALRASIEFYDPDKYNSAASVQDNILFGRPVYGQAKAVQRIGKLLSRTIAHLHLRTEIIEVGLAYSAGTGGKRLGTQQRQKLALVRALVKRPNLLILNNALAVFDDTTQRRLIMTIRNRMKGRAILYINDNAAAARQFDYVMIMRAGRIVETGQLAALDLPGAYMRELAGEPSELVNA
jgi:putative ABC transport system ATP-binding protein